MDFDDNDPIRYDRWIEDALRGVIRQTLSFTADNGLVGEHHFYVTFRTNTGTIDLPEYIKTQHPEEMTIVLQHRYEHLSIAKDKFSVTLRFNGQPVNLIIPFDEITGFTDPSVNFSLQLKTTEINEDDLEDYEYPFEPPAEEQDRNIFSSDVEASPSLNKSNLQGPKEEGDGGSQPTNPPTGEVIALDAFRKK